MEISQTYQGSVSHLQEDSRVIPRGTLMITELQVGTQRFFKTVVKNGVTTIKTSSLKVALYWDKKGDGTKLKRISNAYTAKGMCTMKLTNNNVFTSNGNSKIVARQWIYGKEGPRETYVNWTGIFSPI